MSHLMLGPRTWCAVWKDKSRGRSFVRLECVLLHSALCLPARAGWFTMSYCSYALMQAMSWPRVNQNHRPEIIDLKVKVPSSPCNTPQCKGACTASAA